MALSYLDPENWISGSGGYQDLRSWGEAEPLAIIQEAPTPTLGGELQAVSADFGFLTLENTLSLESPVEALLRGNLQAGSATFGFVLPPVLNLDGTATLGGEIVGVAATFGFILPEPPVEPPPPPPPEPPIIPPVDPDALAAVDCNPISGALPFTGAMLLNMLMARLNRSNAQLRAKALLEVIMYQQMVLEKGAQLPDFLIARNLPIVLPINNRHFDLPASFLRELDEDESLYVLDEEGSYHHVHKVNYEDGLDLWASNERSDIAPSHYAIQGNCGYVFPISQVVRNLRLNCYVTGGVITDANVETRWLRHAFDLVLGGAGAVINALYVKDTEAALYFASLEQAARLRLNIEQTARQEAGRSRRMG